MHTLSSEQVGLHGKPPDMIRVMLTYYMITCMLYQMQVMAEAADSCALTVIRHCQSHRLLPLVSSAVCTDRNAKLRQQCAVYLLQVAFSLLPPMPLLRLCVSDFALASFEMLCPISPLQLALSFV